MSFPNHPPPPPPFLPPPPFVKGDFGRKHGGDNDDEDSNPQAFKRPRTSIKAQSNPSNFPRVNPPNIFYKTRMCLKFMEGNCRNGDQCTFAHGADDLREPPPNWQEIVGRKDNTNGYDDQRTIHRFKICKKYANGEECPYGENCKFLHKRAPLNFNPDVDGPRESSAIRISTSGPVMNVPVMGTRCGPDQKMVADNFESKHVVENKHVVPGSDAFPVNMKPALWKTRLCRKWELTGSCSFGERCHFAHGQADLQLPGVRIEAEAVNMLSSIPGTTPVFIPPTTTDVDAAPAAPVAPATDVKRELKIWEKWKGPKKINGIYADWLDGMEPPLMDPEVWRKKTNT